MRVRAASSGFWTCCFPLLAVTGKRIVPDGTIRDGNGLPRGYWEAKDTDDDLDKEIEKKKAKGYPLNNIIFEDTQTAVLYQAKVEVLRVSLSDRNKLVRLLIQFFSYIEPDIEGFEAAVIEFKDRVPQLAHGLLDKIRNANKSQKKFIAAFDSFFQLCRTSLEHKARRTPEAHTYHRHHRQSTIQHGTEERERKKQKPFL